LIAQGQKKPPEDPCFEQRRRLFGGEFKTRREIHHDVTQRGDCAAWESDMSTVRGKEIKLTGSIVPYRLIVNGEIFVWSLGVGGRGHDQQNNVDRHLTPCPPCNHATMRIAHLYK
jgi:hypothetical protein